MRPRDRVEYAASFAYNALRGAHPRILYLEVTKRCNAFCGFCPYWQIKDRDELKDYSPIVRKLRPFSVTFTGGEPLLRRDIAALVRSLTRLHPRPYTALLTNGWLLTRERVRALREAGLEQLSISVDYVGEKHDRQRGLPGLYRRIDAGMEELKRAGFDRIVINTVIMESNLDEILEVADQTARWGVLQSFSAYSPLKTDSPGELVSQQRIARLASAVRAIQQRKRTYRHIISSDFYLDNLVRYFANGGRLGDRCQAAGQRFYHVDPWGYVKICPEFEPFAHWTELEVKQPPSHDCTKCWYGCRGENEAPITLSRIRDLRI